MRTVDSREQTGAINGHNGYWVSLVAAVAELGLAAELTWLHFELLRDPAHESFCNVNSAVNCDAVAASSYSVLFGLPLSVWGAFAYAASAGFAVWGLRAKRAVPAVLLFAVGFVATLSALGLAYVSAFLLHTLCLLCLVSWGIDLVLLVVAIVLVRAYGWRVVWADFVDLVRYNRSACLLVVALGMLVVGVTARVLPKKVDTATQARVRGVVPSASTRSVRVLPKTGVDEAGHPYIGAQAPKLTIVEYSDYQCPYCAKAHATLRSLVQRYPDDIRVIHRHFPLDNDCNPSIPRPFHTHSCYYARLAVCAGRSGRFWSANDYLFEHGREEAPVALETLARVIGVDPQTLRGCLTEEANGLLKPDIETGVAMRINGTPTFVIDGQAHTGQLPAAVLAKYPL